MNYICLFTAVVVSVIERIVHEIIFKTFFYNLYILISNSTRLHKIFEKRKNKFQFLFLWRTKQIFYTEIIIFETLYEIWFAFKSMSQQQISLHVNYACVCKGKFVNGIIICIWIIQINPGSVNKLIMYEL